MIRFLYWMFLLPLAMGTAFGANWYVDPQATGANNGTSWTDAWTNPTNIVWAGVKPGDTIFVSGGTTSQVYTNALTISKYGTPGNYVTVRVGQETGHNGVAIFDGCRIGPVDSYPQWLIIDGGRSASFVAPTNHAQVISGSTAITNNIGFWIRNVCSNSVGDPTSDAFPSVVYLASASNCRWSWMEVSGTTNSLYGNFRGAVFHGAAALDTDFTNMVFEYLYLHDNNGREFDWSQNPASHFDEMTFRFGWMNLNDEDHFQVGGGWTIRDSVIGPCSGRSYHNDMFQMTGDWIKIYNNDVRESQNSIMRIQTYPGPASQGLRHDVWFFNNVVTEKLGRAPKGGTGVEPFCMVHFDPAHPCDYITFSNIIFANNLFYNSVTNSWNGRPEPQGYGPPGFCVNPVMYWSKGAVTNGLIKHCLFVNNLVVDKEKGIGFPMVTNGVYDSGYSVGYNAFTTNDFIVNYNVIAATNTTLDSPTRMSYLNVSTNAGLGPYAFKNTTNYPAFVDKASDNFELQPTDTAALNTGMNLSSYFNFDSLNRPRNVGGAWDRGPLEYQGSGSTSGPTNGLLVWLTFNDDFSTNNGELVDSSGNGNNAYRFGRIGSVYPTNFPVQIASTNTPGRTNLSSPDYCGRFVWWTNNYGLYGKEGDYAGIVNVSQLTNMATASIMCWARYYAPPYGHDWSWDGNATLLSAGPATGVLGTWGFGRDNDGVWLNNTRFYVMTNNAVWKSAILEFPDNGYTYNGDTINWNHYAVTWNKGVMTSYINGVAYQTNDISPVVTRLQIGQNNNNPTPWIGIGCDTHGGTPLLNDETPQNEYPNNGWMNGVMDDVRIYNRALTAAEVQAVYSAGGDTVLTAKPSPPTGLMIIAWIDSQHALSSH